MNHISFFIYSTCRCFPLTSVCMTKVLFVQVKTLLSHQPDSIGLRIGVRQRGCNGMSYTLDYANKKESILVSLKFKSRNIFYKLFIFLCIIRIYSSRNKLIYIYYSFYFIFYYYIVGIILIK